MIPAPPARNSPMMRNSRSTSRSASADVGSSMMRILAPEPTALAISTSCCSGMLRSPARASGSIEAPILSEQLPGFGPSAAPVDAAPRA